MTPFQTADHYLELHGTMIGRVLAQNALASAAADLQTLRLRQVQENVRDIMLIARKQHLLTRR